MAMDFIVRPIGASDRAIWAEMRAALWPDETRAAHAATAEALLRDAAFFALMAEAADGTAAGFAEIALRKYANGCEAQPAPFPQGGWVDAAVRPPGAAGP